jgi:glycosyltransferase involved in cell wall biosynthesis
MSVISRHGQRAFDGRPVCDRVGGPELCRAAIGGSGVNPEAKETPAPAEPTGVQQSSAECPGLSHPTDESAARDEQAAINRSLFMMQDHLAELDARLARLEPLLRAGSLARTGLRRLAGILRFPLKLAALILHWRETGRRIKDARFRSERLVFDSSRSVFMRRVDFPAFAGHLRRSFGFFPPAVYRVEPRQRLALARRPRVLHAIANVWIGGSTQLIVDLHNHLGHRFEMTVVTSALPAHGSHDGMAIDVVPKPNSRHLVRCIFSRFRPHIVHVHYWGDVDEPWYKTIFEIAAEFGCPILQNINTPVAPFAGVRVDRNVFVSRSVLDQYGSAVPASVIHPGIELDRFAPPAVIDPHAFDTIGMIYRLESDKLDADAIELFLAIAERRPTTRIVIIGDGSLFAHFRSRVEQEGRLSQFEFTGYVPYEELPAQFARFRTFVAPVWQESFGQVVPFAMSAGLAVAGYNVGAIPEILGGVETLGASLAETAKIVAALLDDPARIVALGERNRALALERFSVEDMAIRYFQLYRDLAPRVVEILSRLPDAVHFPI